ncbi:unnamed protein product [Rotaria sordida]|uniref:Uncharacterized protein n=2 Tax=Rotaria sordida TaxID=392033 RepID=A0A818GV20_9BILA|nr:unnamed protein product [Rotaria sordida]
MANRVSSSSSSYNRNNHRQNISSSNNRSSRSTHTTHTYASTNTFNTEPTYTTTPITGDPQTLHSCYVTSSNYHPPPPPTSPTNSLTRHYREYEPSYPSITRYRTPSSSSPFRKTHYLDDSDEEIINEEILEITDLNHYPTLIERWGDDTKTIVRQEGEFKFEDFVEFEETEPTVVEEILYELVYSGDKLKTCRQIDRSRSESRNFRKIKKRRTKRKRQLLDGSSYLTSQPSSRDTSGTRSPYYNDYRYSPERSSTPTQSSTLSSSWQSTGFIPNDKSSLDISIRNRLDDQNYVNYIRVNETDPFRSHTQVQYYPQTRITNHLQYNTFQTDLGNRQNKHFYDNIYDLPTTNDNTLHNIEEYIPVISEERGITKINLTPTNYDYANENLLMKNKIDTNKDTYDISSSDDLLTSTRTTDNKEQSRTNIIDQTSVQKEINNREPYHSANIEKQINKITASKYDELEKEDEEHSSTTEPTIREIMKDDETAGKDTDEDASFSDSEQIPSQSFMSDEQNQSLNLIKTTEEESHPSYLLSTNEKQDDHETISTTTTTTTDSSINRINELETQLPTSDSIEKSSETTIDREQIKPMQTLETSSIEHVTQQLLPEYLIETKETSLEKTPETSIPTNISDEKKQSLFKDQTSSENDEELRSMLNSITAHLMPELPRYDDETEDEQSLLSEPKSSEEPISQDDQSVDSIVQKSIEDAKELWTQSHDQIGTVDQTKSQIDKTTVDQYDTEQDNKEKSSSIIPTTDNTISNIQETNLEKISLSTDSLVNIVEQIITDVKKPQDEQDIISQVPSSSVITDEISSTQLQSKQLFSQDVDDVANKQPLNINCLADIIYQINSQPFQSSLDKQQPIYIDAKKSIEPIRQEDRLSLIESTQPVITSDEQQQQQQQQLISSTSSITSEAIEKPTSKEDQSPIEFQSRKETDEQLSSDSLVNIVRQIHSMPQLIRLPSTDIKTKPTSIIEQEIKKPLVDSHVEIVTTNESIPSKSVDSSIQSVVDTFPSTSTTTLDETTLQKTTEEERTQDDKGLTETERFTTIDKDLHDIPTTSSTTEARQVAAVDTTIEKPQARSLSTKEVIVTVPQPLVTAVTDHLPTVDHIVQPTIRTELQVQKTPIDSITEMTDLVTTKISPDVATTQQPFRKPTDLKQEVQPQIEESPLIKTAEVTTSENYPQSTKDTKQEDEAERLSLKALTEAVREILATPLTVHLPTADRTAHQILETEEILEKPTLTSVPEVTKPVEEILPSKVISTEEERRKSAEIKEEEELQQPSITPTVIEIVEETTTESHPPSVEDKEKEHEAERISSEALTEAVREILATPLTVHLPTVDHTAHQILETEEILEKPTLTSVPEVTRPVEEVVRSKVISTEEERRKSAEIKEEELQQPSIKPTVIETVEETTTESHPPSAEDKEKKHEAERISVDALTEAVREILATPVTVHLPTVDHTVEQITDTEQVLQKPTFTSVPEASKPVEEILPSELISIGEQRRKSAEIKEEELQQPSIPTTVIETVEETTTESHPPSVEDKVKEHEAERISSKALAEAVREILATPLTVHLPTADHTARQILETEEILEKPTLTSVPKVTKPIEEILPSKVISTEEEKRKSAEIKEEELQQPSIKPTVIETVEETTTESHPPSVEHKEKEYEAERISVDALTEAVREILATPVTVHLPTVDHTVEQITDTEQVLQKPTFTSVPEASKPIEEILPSELISIGEQRRKSAEIKEEELQQPSITTTVIETVEETTTESHPPSVEDKEKEHEAERISSKALTEAGREILATPLTVHLPTVDHTARQIIETEEILEKPTLTSVPEVTKPVEEVVPSKVISTKEERKKSAEIKEEELQQPSIPTTVIETVEETTTESHPPSIEDKEKEHEAERISVDALTEAIREILATPATVQLPTVDHIIQQTTEPEQILEKPSFASASEITKPAEEVLPSEVISTEEERTKQADTKEEELQQPRRASTVIETVKETTTEYHPRSVEDKAKEHEAEHIPLETLTEIVREILATPITVHLPTVDHTLQEITETKQVLEMPSIESPPEVSKPVDEILSSQVISIEEQRRKSAEIKEEELQQPSITPTVIETVKETTTESHLPSTEEKVKEHEAERISSEALTEIVRDILFTPITVHFPRVGRAAEQTSRTEQLVEPQPIDSLSKIVKEAGQIITTPVATTNELLIEPRRSDEEVKQETSTTSSIIKTVEEPTSDGHIAPAEHAIIQDAAERISSEALAAAVRETLATPLTIHHPTRDDTVHEIIETEEVLEKPTLTSTPEVTKPVEEILSSEVILTNEERRKSAEIKEEELQQPSIKPTVIETIQETTTESHPPSAEDKEKEHEAERISVDALTEAVREILAAPVTVHLPTVDHSVEQITDTEQVLEKSSLTTLPEVTKPVEEVLPSQAITTEEQRTESRDTKQEELQQPSATLSLVKIVQEVTSELHPPSVEDKVKEHEGERIPSETLTGIVREILATPVTVHLPTVDHAIQQTTKSEQVLEKPSIETLSQITKPVEEAPSSEIITIEEERMKPTDIKQEELQQSSITTTVIETVEETTTESHPPSVEDKAKEDEAERISVDALTEAIREILATPATVHLPTVDHTIEQTTEPEQVFEKPSLTSVSEITKSSVEEVLPSEVISTEEERTKPTDTKEEKLEQPSITPTVIETVEETITESHLPSVEDKEKEHEAERISLDALTEAVREILATPATVHLPTVNHTIEQTTKVEQVLEKPSLTSVPEVTKPVEEVLPSEVTLTEEQRTKPQDTKQVELQQPSIASTVIETVEETTTESHVPSAEDKVKEHQGERIPSETLSKVVREILATPVTVHLPTVARNLQEITETGQVLEKPSFTSTTEVTKQVEEVPPSEVITTEKERAKPKDIKQEELQQSSITSVAFETIDESRTKDQALPVVDRTQEDLAEHISSEALTEAVREILATPVSVHLPTVDSISEKTTTTNEEEVEKPTGVPLSATSEEETGIILPAGARTEGKLQLSDTKPDEVQLLTQTPPVSESMKERTTEFRTSSAEDSTIDHGTEHLLSVSLSEAAPEPSDTSVSVQLPSIDSKPESVESVEQLVVIPETAVAEKIDTIPENVVSNETITMISDVEKTSVEKQHPASDLGETEEDESPSIDSLVGSAREILATPLTAYLPPIETDIGRSLDEKLFQEQLDSSTTTSKLEDIEKPVTAVRLPSVEETEHVPSDSLVEVTREILTTPSVKDKMETVLPLEDIKEPIDSLVTIVHEVVTSPERSITDINTKKKEISYVQPQFNEPDESISLISKLTSLEKDQIPLQSTITDTTEQPIKESPVQDIISGESELLLRPTIITSSTSPSADESLPYDENQFISSSLYTTINTIVNNAIINACDVLEQTIPDENDDQSFFSISSEDELPDQINTDINLTNDIGTKSLDDYYSISGLTNIVNSILKLPNEISPEFSIPHQDNKVIVSSKSDFDEHINITELPNIVDTNIKTLNIQTLLPEQSDITEEQTSLQRASAVKLTFRIDDVDQDISTTDAPTFFVPETPNSSEVNFRELYEHRHFISNDVEESPIHFTPIDRQESVQSTVTTASEEKKIIPDSPLAYYELQEKRHTLMSPQKSNEIEKPEQKSSSLTTWTTMQPLIDYEEKDMKQETTDINLDDHAYEYARRFDLESPSIMSNLPTREYRQVFGIPDDIVNTIDDMTHHIDQTLAMESKYDQSSIVSDDVKNLLSQPDEQFQSDDVQYTIPFNNVPVSDNVKRIIEALEALESDLLEQKDSLPLEKSSITKSVEDLINQQNVLSSNLLSTALDNDIKETLENQTIIFPSKDEFVEDDLLPKTIETKMFDDTIQDDILKNSELDSRYAELLEHIDNLEKPLVDLQSSSSSISENETIISDIKEEKDDDQYLQQRHDTLTDHITTLEDATNKNLLSDTDKQVVTSTDEKSTEDKINIDGLAKTIEQILATPFRTVISSSEKRAHEESMTDSNLQMTLEQILVQTQYPTTYVKLSPPIDTIPSSYEINDKQEEIQITEPHDEITISTSTDQEHILSKEETSDIKEKDSSTIFEKVTSAITDAFSIITGASPKSTTIEETIIPVDSSFHEEKDLLSKIPTAVTETTTSIESAPTTKQVVSPLVTEDETAVLTSPIENEKILEDEQQQTSTIDLLETTSILRPTIVPSTETPVTSLSKEAELIQQDYPEIISTPVAGHFSSSDVYHAYKQPVEPIVEQKPDSSSIIDKATTIVTNIISSVTSALPTTETTEDSTSTIKSTVLHEEVSPPVISKSEISVAKPSLNEQDIEKEQTPSTGILNKLKNLLPSGLLSTETEHITSEETTPIIKEDQVPISSSFPESTVTTVSEEHLTKPIEPIVKMPEIEEVPSSIAGYFSSSDVYHAYKQPTEPIIEKEQEPSGIIDKATAIVGSIISSLASAPSTTKTPDEDRLTSKSVIIDKEIPSASLTESEINVTKSSSDEQHIVHEPVSSTGLLEIMMNFLPSSLQSTKIEEISSETPSAPVKDEEETVISSVTDTSETRKFEEHVTKSIKPQVEMAKPEEVPSSVAGYFSSSDVYHAYKQPVEPMIEEESKSPIIVEKATSILNNIIFNFTPATPTLESADETTPTIQSPIIDQPISSVPVTEKEISISKPSLDEQDIEKEQTTSTGILNKLKNLLPSGLLSTDTEHITSEEITPVIKEDQIPLSSSFPESTMTTVSEEHLTKPTEPIVKMPETEEVPSSIAGYFSSSDVYHAYKQPVEPMIAKEEHSSSFIGKVTSVVENIISSVSSSLPTTIRSADIPISDDTSSSKVNIVESQPPNVIENIMSSTESSITHDKVEPSTEEVEEIVVSKPLEEPEKKKEDIRQEESSTGLVEFMKNVLATIIPSVTSTKVSTEEEIQTGDDKETMSSSLSEAKTTSEISEKSLTESSLPVVEIQQQKDVISHSLSDTTESDISPVEKLSIEQVIEEKDLTSGTDEGISSITDALSAIPYTLPTSTPLFDTHKEKLPSDDDQTEISESSLQTPLTDESKRHGIFDIVLQPTSSFDEITSTLVSFDEKSTTPELSSTLPEKSMDNNQLENSNVNEVKETLIETAKEILAVPLQSAVDTYEKIISTQEQLASPISSPSKVITSDYPSLTKQDKVVDSEIERLSATDQQSIDDSDKHKSIINITEEIKTQDQDEKKPSQQLQVIGDDYAWYSSHYTIADADAKMGQLYEELSHTLKQLEQRPRPTTLEFSPEPHEKIPIPDYDRQVLVETQDTREKVHELAQISTTITTTITTPQDEQYKDEDEDDFQVAHHRKRIPSSSTTVHKRTSSPTMIPSKTTHSPDIDLVPLALHGHPVSPISSSSSSISQTTTSSSSSKKKNKKQKKDKKEMMLFEAPIPTISDADKYKSDVVQSEVIEEHIETTKSEQLPPVTTIDDSHKIDQPSDKLKHEIEQLQQTMDEPKQTLPDRTSEQQHSELLSASIASDIIEPQQIDDDNNNDSTSSDASQWLSSSFTTFPEDNKLDTHTTTTTEQTIVTQTSTTTSSADHELLKSESLSTSSATKKKKSKQQSTDQVKIQPSEIQSLPLTIEEPKVESKPTLTTSPPVKTTITTIPIKAFSSPEEEEEVIDDNEGFRVVSYRKHVPSTAGYEKTLPSSTKATSKQRISSDIDPKHGTVQRRQVSSIPVPTSTITTVPQTTTTKTKTKHKIHKKETTLFDAPSGSSPSTDTDGISSSSIDSSRHKHIEQQPIDQHKTISSSSTSQLKPLSSNILISDISPSLTTEVESKQQSKDDEKTLQSQIPSITIHESRVQSEPIISLPIKPSTTTFRVKASTSPDEEEEGEDDEGFQVVRYRKRISSAPRSGKTLPPIPPQTHKQNLGRGIDLKPFIIHGRHGSGSRSIPRTTTGSQISSHKRQQIRPKQDRQQMPPLNIPHSPTSKETNIMSSFNIENKTSEQTKQPISDKVQRINDPTLLQSSFINQKPSENIKQVQSTDIEQQPILPIVESKPLEQKEIETILEPLPTTVSSLVDQSIQQIVQEYLVPTKDEIKHIVQQQSSIKEPISSTTPTTTETQKSTIIEDEDNDDGFRVVRYRKHVPSTTIISQQPSLSSDTDKKPVTIPKRQTSPSSLTSTTPTSTVLPTTTTQKKKPKKTKETTVKTDITSPSSTTDTDLISSSKEESTKRTTTTTTKHIQKVIESQVPTKDVSSIHPDKEIIIPIEDHKSIQSINLTDIVQKTSDDIQDQNQIQSIKSATSPTVISADTSEELFKKPKKKHKRSKREPSGLETSTPSDEISSTTDNILTTKPITSTSTEEKSEKILLKEETLLPQTNEPITPIDDEQIKTISTKKHSKKRKKKVHTIEKQDQDDDLLTSSTASTTDKDSSSTAAVGVTIPMKSTFLDSSTKTHLKSDDNKQELESTTTQNKKKKSKILESTIHTTTPTVTSKILPEKITDVQFKFKKGGELIVTNQSSLERSPREWGTVKFTSDESNLLQQDKPSLSIEQTSLEQLPIENESKIEQTIDNETSIEQTRKSIESSETGGEADLGAYRDQTGRLRRKKPRKHTSKSSTSDDIISSTLEPQTSEEIKLDHQTISEHWAAVLASPISNIDEEQKIPSEQIHNEHTFEDDDDDTNEKNSKLDTFLPEYIRQTIKTKSSLRSSSLNDDRSKLSSHEASPSITHTRSTGIVFPSSSNRSTTSTDTSESESRKYLRESLDEETHSTEDSSFISTSNQTEHDTILTSSSLPPTGSIRKKKQRPKMLKKDIEAKTLLTHEFDDTPLTITEIQPSSSSIVESTKDDESFLSSIRHQFASAISTISDSFTTALSLHKPPITDEQITIQSDEPVPSTDEPSIIPITTSTESTISTRKKPSTRSPRKRSKRDSGPDYEILTSPASDDAEQSFTNIKTIPTIPTSIDNDQTDFIKVETHKHQSRQRTLSGRHVSNTEENNEQQAILADDEEDEDFTTKPIVVHGTGSSTNIQTPIESTIEQQDSSSATTTTTTTKRRRHKQKSKGEEVEFIAQVPDEVKPDKQDIISDQQTTTTNEQLRPVQGFHSYTPNKYQYNQYEEVPTGSNEQSSLPTPPPPPPPPTTTTTTTASDDTIVTRGFSLWLQKGKENESIPSPSLKKDESSTTGSGLTRAMQSLIIQPVDTDNDEEEDEEDSWNGPRAKKPTYTSGVRIEKCIHTTSGYNINHPRSTTVSPWLMSQSNENSYQDDQSKYDPDDEEDSINDVSERQQLSHPINTQFSTREERQRHLNNLADLTFQTTLSNLSSSTSSLSSAAKWNETSIRSDDNNQQQANFTDDDVQRCLGEFFYRESLAADTLQAEQRTLTSLDDLVLKPSQLSEETDDDDNDNDDNDNDDDDNDNDDDDDDDNDGQRNRNNNNNINNSSHSINFDEWAHFLECQYDQQLFSSSVPSSLNTEQNLLTSYECSYARELGEDTLISDADRSNVIDYVQHTDDNERQRYGDFTLVDDDSIVPELITNCPVLSSNPNSQLSCRHKPSETFQRWRNQSNREQVESSSNLSNVTISTENQNDDEIFIYHSDGGLSRRVRPTT